MTRILLVDDEPVLLRTMQRLLRAESGWQTTACTGGAEALAVLSSSPVDIIVSDLCMPGMDGIKLLQQVREHHPGVARIVVSGNAALSAAVQASTVAHQYLAKPCPGEQLRATIARVMACLAMLERDGVRARATWLPNLPPMPRTFAAISAALQDEGAEARAIAGLVERDSALTAKVLQLVNGAFFGQSQRVTSVEWAVRLLGAKVLRSVVLTQELFGSVEARAPAMGRLQSHSLATAALARRMAKNRAEAETAFAAALLHDAGKLVQMCTADRPSPAGEEEAAGLEHAAVGGCVLSLWGLPEEITDAVMWHHQPAQCPPATRRLAALVHAADFVEHERAGDAAAAPLDLASLAELHMDGELDRWRELARTGC